MSRRRSTRRKQLSQDLFEPPARAAKATSSIVTPPRPIQTAEGATRQRSPTRATTTSPLSPISPWPPIDLDTTGDDRPDVLFDSSSPHRAKDAGKALHSTDSHPAETVPTAKEVYGSIAVLLTFLGYWTYLAWAFLPSRWLDTIGWTWYPDRQWAIVIPCYLMVVVLSAYFSYGALTAFLTPDWTSASLITDPYSNIPNAPKSASVADPIVSIAEKDRSDVYARLARAETTEAVDIPMEMVNRILYPPRKRPVPSHDPTRE